MGSEECLLHSWAVKTITAIVFFQHRVLVSNLCIWHHVAKVVLVCLENIIICLLEYLFELEIVLTHHLNIEIIIPRNKTTVTHCSQHCSRT